MTAARQTSSEVEVGVDPATAFTVFTEELDLWWVRGPINFFAAGRAVEMRCEPGVGGRVLEVYADGDALELGRITVWEPGRRLGWISSLDDVVTDVQFEPTAGGATVRVTATIPPGGENRGGGAFVAVVPRWFRPWVQRREGAPREPEDIARLGVEVGYRDPVAAARWLAATFGFASPDPLPDVAAEGAQHVWIEFRIGNCSLVLSRSKEGGAGAATPWVYVDDVEGHCARARAGGATIVTPRSSPWGLPFYEAEDLEGRRWRFLQARPTMR